ncbi:hypothetical protein B0H13DRAFT_2084076, partial [Mycena leptocephala]
IRPLLSILLASCRSPARMTDLGAAGHFRLFTLRVAARMHSVQIYSINANLLSSMSLCARTNAIVYDAAMVYDRSTSGRTQSWYRLPATNGNQPGSTITSVAFNPAIWIPYGLYVYFLANSLPAHCESNSPEDVGLG